MYMNYNELGKAKKLLDVPRYTGNVISWVALIVAWDREGHH